MINSHPRRGATLGPVGYLQIDCINNIHQHTEDDYEELQKAVDDLTKAANKLLEEIKAENETRKKENAELKVCCDRSEVF